MPDRKQRPKSQESYGVTEFFRQWEREGRKKSRRKGESLLVCLGKRELPVLVLIGSMETMVGSVGSMKPIVFTV